MLEGAVAQLFEMCVAAGDHVVDNELFDRMRIPPMARPQIRRTWESEPPSVYGRFDLRYDGERPPQAAGVQRRHPDRPGRVRRHPVELAPVHRAGHATSGTRCTTRSSPPGQRNLLKWERRTGVRPRVHLAWTSEETSGEDRMTVAYLMDTVVQAGYEAIELIVEDIVLDDGDGRFYDQQGRHLDVVFKLYPWEWLIEDEFGPAVLADSRPAGRHDVGRAGLQDAVEHQGPAAGAVAAVRHRPGARPVPAAGLLRRRGAVQLAELRAQAAVGPRGRQRRDRPRRRRCVDELPGRYGTEGFVRPGVRAVAGLPRASTVRTIRCSAPGWWTASPPGSASARATA